MRVHHLTVTTVSAEDVKMLDLQLRYPCQCSASRSWSFNQCHCGIKQVSANMLICTQFKINTSCNY